jgi:lipoyl(octanoyl) transferase
LQRIKQQQMNTVWFQDIGTVEYGLAWDMQEQYMQDGLAVKAERFHQSAEEIAAAPKIPHYLFICRHPHVYTLGKSGALENLLLNDERMKEKEVTFYKTNRGGDITYHGPGQMVAYPILDLDQFFNDLGRYMSSLEEVIIRTIGAFGLKGERLPGSIGVWLDADDPSRARKICAMGVRSSRWITIHGLALNINTNMEYFNYIVPCGIVDKGVTSMQQELGKVVDESAVQKIFLEKFSEVFDVEFKSFEQNKVRLPH